MFLCWNMLDTIRTSSLNRNWSLYEELHCQLVSPNDTLNHHKGNNNEGIESSESSESSSKEDGGDDDSMQSIQNPYLSKSQRRFQ